MTWLAALPAIATVRGLFVGNENFVQLHHTRLQITSAPSRDAVKLPASAAQLRHEFVLQLPAILGDCGLGGVATNHGLQHQQARVLVGIQDAFGEVNGLVQYQSASRATVPDTGSNSF